MATEMKAATTETFTDKRVRQLFPGLQRLLQSRDNMDLEIISMEHGSTFAHKMFLESRMPALVDNIETNRHTGKSTLQLSNFTRGYVDYEI